ncbi:MAG: DUF4062 domain-containing protein, partial [Candidatus Hydrogenedentes bacterium]|nr:DUF4062 domain-containing protein [Candidatus Hydrogenedentota bacterium]
MNPRPTIFISAVTSELKGARDLVAKTLEFMGYQPVFQDIFGTQTGNLCGVLRDLIDPCEGLIQLVGFHYGSEPPMETAEFGRVSYTQYEALYALQQGKKVFHFVDVTPGSAVAEPEDKRELQQAYRE